MPTLWEMILFKRRNKMKIKSLGLLLPIILSVSCYAKSEKENHKIAENFCYALQIQSVCDGLIMRMDTENKVNSLLDEPIRDKGSKYKESCNKGLFKAEGGSKECKKAWDKFGCYGSEMRGLLQTNPFTDKKGPKCKFNPNSF